MSDANDNKTVQNDESAPLKVLVKGNDDIPDSYGSITPSSIKYRELRIFDMLIFAIMFWNGYLSRKMMYPFIKDFSEFYNISISSFSFILSAYDIGGATSIIMMLLPRFHHIRIHLFFFILTFILAVLYFIMSFGYIFISLFVIRIGMGFVCTLTQSEVRGVLSVFTKGHQPETNKTRDNTLTFRVLLVESSWFTSSIGWVAIGVILNRLNVLYVWYFGSVCALITALLCYCLPPFTVAKVLAMKSQSKCIESILDSDVNLWKLFHLHFLNIGTFLFGMAYGAFLATFGPYMQHTFHLNAEQLGFQTFFISAAELVSLLTTNIAAKYKSNMWLSIFSSFSTVIVSVVFVIGLSFELVNKIFIWILLFAMTICIEYTYLNVLIAYLNMAPHGYEGKMSLIGQTTTRAANIFGVVIGVHIQEWHGFNTVMKYMVISQVLALILFVAASKQYDRHKSKSVTDK